ncbi:MAG: hypothetical protein ABFC63_09335 [Thermoguttaceae bacterium]
MMRPHQRFSVLENRPFDFPQFMSRDATISGQANRIEPKLALTVRRTHMNLGGSSTSSQ